MRVLIAGGTVVTPTGSEAADVMVDGERIVALAQPGSEVVSSFARRGAAHRCHRPAGGARGR